MFDDLFGPEGAKRDGAEIFKALRDAASERILILDGAMGTQIQGLGFDEDHFRGDRFIGCACHQKGNNDLLILTQPDAIEEIHYRYAMAGADILETNTFSSTRIAQADYEMENAVYDLNREGAAIVRRAAQRAEREDGRRRFVAGAIGPTNRTASISPDVNNPGYRAVSFDDLRIAYGEQIDGLIDGGADIILIETIFDTLNAKAAIFACEERFEAKGIRLPVMISGTITDLSGRTLSGQTPSAFWNSVRHANPFTIGLNCALGADAMRPHLQELSDVADTFVCAYPNAGLPNEFGQYDETPEMMARQVEGFVRDGLVNIVGGCCGSTPEHIRAIAEAVKDYKPREIPEHKPFMSLSGLEPFVLTKDIPFVNVGERTNVTGSARFRKLITAGDYTAALAVARDQVENGAQIIDINMDEGLIDSEKAMVEFLNLIAAEPDIARVPVMIDSSKFEIIEAGLKCVQGKSIVNSISLKEGEEKFLQQARLVHNYGAAVVVMAFDEVGQADTYQRKVEICARAYKLAFTRREAVAHRAGFIGFFRIAGPVQVLHDLLAEKQEIVALDLRKRDSKHSGRGAGVYFRFRYGLRQGVCCPDPAFRSRSDETRQPWNGIMRWRCAMAVPVVADPQPDTVAGHQIGKILKTVDQQFFNVGVMGGQPQKPVERRMGVVDGVEAALLLQNLQMHGEKFPEHFRSDPNWHAQHTRRIMVAGDQAPQGAIDNHRNRHGGGNTHIAEIFAMDGRDAAQMRVREIERLTGDIDGWQDRNAGAAGIGDDAQGVLEIKCASLLWNIAGGEILPEKALQLGLLGLRHDLAGAVFLEAVDHHPVVTQRRLYQACGSGDQAFDAVGFADAVHHLARRAERLRVAARGLEFDDGGGFVAME